MGSPIEDLLENLKKRAGGGVGAAIKTGVRPKGGFTEILILNLELDEIERAILLRLIDTWIYRLKLDVGNGVFWPTADKLCDDMRRDASLAEDHSEKVRDALAQLTRDNPASDLPGDTIRDLARKAKEENAAFEKANSRAHRSSKPPTIEVAMAINEKLVLITHL